MADDLSDPLVLKAIERIAALDAESIRRKRWVNDAYEMEGLPPKFPEVMGDGGSVGAVVAASVAKPATKWEAGDFYGKSFTGAARTILERRYSANGSKPSPSSVDDIHDALTQGSFAFETTGADAQKNGIRISLGKNSATFVRLPNSDLFGLVEWYGAKVKKTAKKATTGAPTADEAADAAAETAAAAEEEFGIKVEGQE